MIIDSGAYSGFPNLIMEYLTDNVGLFDSFIEYLDNIKAQVDHFFDFTVYDFYLLPDLVRGFAGLLIAIYIIKTILSLGGASA